MQHIYNDVITRVMHIVNEIPVSIHCFINSMNIVNFTQSNMTNMTQNFITAVEKNRGEVSKILNFGLQFQHLPIRFRVVKEK